MKLNAPAAMLAIGAIVTVSPACADGDNTAARQDLFASRCVACHGLNPTRKPGPPLAESRP